MEANLQFRSLFDFERERRVSSWNARIIQYSKSMAIHVLRILLRPGGRLNKKDGLTRYGDSHVKDKTS